jgi:hypothetical protein
MPLLVGEVGQLFHVWFAFMLAELESYAFSFLFDKYVKRIGLSFDTRIEKMILCELATLVIAAVNFASFTL